MLAGSFWTSTGPAYGASSGAAFAWGSGAYGQLGDGSEVSSDVPVPVSDLSEVTAVSGGYGFGLALLGDGTVAAWGENESGLLGDGSQTNSDVPVAVSGLSKVTAVAAGWYHSLALLSNGTVEAWGYNGFGELGDGSEEGFSDVPVAVKNLSGVIAVAAGTHTSMALLSDGTVKEWGGDRGDVPTVVSGLSEVVAISAGEAFSLALLKNGTVMAWGNNEYGRLGDGASAGSETPVPVSGLSEVTAISAGASHSLALLKNGTVMAWGKNSAGQLGDGTSSGPETCVNGFGEAVACSRTPVPVGGLSGVTAVAAGGKSSLALLNNGTVMAWGDNAQGQLGDRSTINSDVPVQVTGLRGATAISAGSWYQGLAVADASAPPATITKVALAYGPPAGGTRVTITGTNFSGVTEVTFGSTNATSFKVESETSITAVAPPGTGVVDVGVGISGVLSPTSPADRFSYAPAVTKVEPDRGPAVGGTAVTIAGTNFTGATQVKFGSAEATSFKVESETSITAVSPPSAGKVDVTVRTPGGISPPNPADLFDYAPIVNRVTPEYGPPSGGTQVTITGTDFAGATEVKFGPNPATSFVVESNTKITAVTPAFSGGEEDGVGVYVTTPGGTNNSEECGYPFGFRYQPAVTSVVPRFGPAGGGTEVRIRGAAFEGVIAGGGLLCNLLEPVLRSVNFGSTPATSWKMVSPSEIIAVAPPGTGTVDVTVESVIGSSPITPGDQFSYGTPLIEGESVANITEHNATLEAKINPEGRALRYQFQVATDPSEFLPEIVCPTTPASELCLKSPITAGALPIGLIEAAFGDQALSLDLASAGMTLQPGTTYHYRVLAAKSVQNEDTIQWEGQSVYGAEQTFMTPAASTTNPGNGNGSSGSQSPITTTTPTSITTTTPTSIVTNIPAFSDLSLPAVQHGDSLLVGLTVDLAGSRVEVDATVPAAHASSAKPKSKPKPVMLARLVRASVAAGRLKITVPLNAKGRRALKHHKHLTLAVRITVTPPTGKPQTGHRTVTLKSR